MKVKYKSFYLRSHALRRYAMMCFASDTFAVNINQQEKRVLNKSGSIYFKIVVILKKYINADFRWIYLSEVLYIFMSKSAI